MIGADAAAAVAAAEKLASSGGVTFAPNHHYGAVGPMTGITTKSMPLLVVENRAFGNRAVCALNEGLGKVMRFGGNDAEVLAGLAESEVVILSPPAGVTDGRRVSVGGR